jgi:uncharacterized protein
MSRDATSKNSAMREETIAARIAALNWAAIAEALHARGWATTTPILTRSECDNFIAQYDQEHLFRSRIVMARYNFGRGEYKYFSYPLPAIVQSLREAFYPRLARIANVWQQAFGETMRFPDSLDEWLSHCHSAGQTRPTPLLLKYEAGDYNCLHQDLYGEHMFPLQATFLLSQPREDFTGGEFVLTEQRPRTQSRAQVVALARGEAVIFAVHHRPAKGSRGVYRANLRHGVSEVTSGRRFTAGIVFHDAA